MLKKEIAGSFLKLAASGNVVEAYERYVDHNFIHHNQHFKGDSVIAHSQVLRIENELPPIAAVHIFRFNANSKIIELWDVGQELTKDSPNTNGVF